MGTWATGPFDNDSAADFALDIHSCSGPDARQDLLLATLRAGTETLDRTILSDEYSWGFELEFAIAAAAFVADEYTGRKEFTNNAHARGESDDLNELGPYAEFHPPTPDLLAAARSFTARMIKKMRVCGISDEWISPIVDIGFALATSKETS